MTRVLTTAIIIKGLSFGVIMQQTFFNLNFLFISVQNRTIRHISMRREGTEYYNNVFQNVTFFTFTRISYVDAKPDLSLLSV